MHRTLPLLLLAAGLAGAEDPAPAPPPPLKVTVPAFPNTSCPIMGKRASRKLFVDTTMGRIYVCCASCNEDILADVERAHRTAYPVVRKAGNAACPVTGKPVKADGPKVVLQGYEVGLCCTDCADKARADAQAVLALATNPKVKDVGNRTCPVTGMDVAPNTIVLVGDEIVRLSSEECVAEVEKDGAKALARAKEIVAEAKAANETK